MGVLVGIRFLFLSAIILFSTGALATPQPCLSLTRQLNAMAEAQSSLLSSMVKKNDALAGTLDQYAQDFSERGQRLRKVDIVSLRKSADAFRGHSSREMALIEKFNKASKELIEKVNHCLVQNHKLDHKQDNKQSNDQVSQM